MATLADRRQSIYRALQTISNWQVYPYLEQAPQLPALMVGAPAEGNLDETFDGSGSYGFTVYALCNGDQSWSTAQQLIDPLLAPGGNGSVRAALDAQPDIAGQIVSIEFSDYGPGANWAGATVFMARIRLVVLS